ncbi:MAG: anti-sigma factor family protein [Sphingomonadaceae bacterium]
MTCEHESTHLLPFYVSAALDDRRRQMVEHHLATCEECRADLALWKEAGAAVSAANQELPAPSPALFLSTLDRVHRAEQGPLRRAWQLLRAQALLVKREIWPACATVMGLGYVVAMVGTSDDRAPSVVVALAPMVAAVSVAMLYGPEQDPALELSLATPTSPRQVLIARLALVFGYDLLLALAATAGLVAVTPPAFLGTIIVSWLGPMTFLSALALVLSLRSGTTVAVAVSLSLWIARLIASSSAVVPVATTSGALSALARIYAQGWANTPALLALSCLLLALAVWSVRRDESLSRLHSG